MGCPGLNLNLLLDPVRKGAIEENLGRKRGFIVVLGDDVDGDEGSDVGESSEGSGRRRRVLIGGWAPNGEGVGGDEVGSAGPCGGRYGEEEKA